MLNILAPTLQKDNLISFIYCSLWHAKKQFASVKSQKWSSVLICWYFHSELSFHHSTNIQFNSSFNCPRVYFCHQVRVLICFWWNQTTLICSFSPKFSLKTDISSCQTLSSANHGAALVLACQGQNKTKPELCFVFRMLLYKRFMQCGSDAAWGRWGSGVLWRLPSPSWPRLKL